MMTIGSGWLRVAVVAISGMLAACGSGSLPPAPKQIPTSEASRITEYVLGPLDLVQIHVSGVEELSVVVPIRPDGRVSIPLVEDLRAAGKPPSGLARDIEQALAPFVQEPSVSVVVQQFADTSPYTIRVIGAVENPRSVPFHPRMTVLDVMVAVGGLSEFAAGNQATLIRKSGEGDEVYGLLLEDLLIDADVGADAPVQPGDVIVVPESLL